MIPQQPDKTPTISNSTISNNAAMESTNKNSRLVLRLLADAKNLLQDSYSEEEFRQTFTVIKSAKSRGFLGSHKSSDCCFVDAVNIANDILRAKKFEDVEPSAITKQSKAIYVYVSLVAIGLIPA
ncbi:hypothetical protein QUA42_24295 [Microcoleus sp. Pol11C2]|uniref:hypothetical protein n=1 Tax=Microcoleus sp. Pol11C2 TaxID=3055389 RepID=UPI002FD2CBEC